MRKTIFILLGLAFSLLLNAQTEVSGQISENTVWNKSGSPYIITSSIVIMPNIELTIESGVTIEILSNSGIVVRGSLKALGSLGDTIYFAPSETDLWQGITIDNNFNGSIRFSYAKAVKASVLFDLQNHSLQNDTILTLKNCWFNENQTVIQAEDENENHIVIIEDCKFSNTYTYCFLYSGNCVVKRSEFVNYYRDPNDMGDYRGFYNSGELNTVIDSCIFSGFKYAVLSNGFLTNSTLYNNDVAVATMNSSSPYMRNNYIYDNEIGIHTSIYLGSNPPDQIQYNKICNNGYNIYQFYSGDAYVTENCWCTTDETEISDRIYDIFDNNELGMVYYAPIDSTCSNITSIPDRDINEESLLTKINIYPNPASDYIYINFPTNDYTFDVISIKNACGITIMNLDKDSRVEQDSYRRFNINNLHPGLYMICIEIDGINYYKKIVKL